MRNAGRLFLGWLALSGGAFAEPTATATLRPWTNYQVIMWVGDSARKQPGQWPVFLGRLREMGVTAGMVYGDGDPQPWVENRMPYYVENMVNRGLCLKWNSKVSDWDKFVTAWKGPRDEAALVRDYCLDDPQWREWGKAEVQRLARRHRAHNPLLYDLRDELSVTISANPFDYDFNPIALRGFREWLKTQYPSLAALNAQWQTQFRGWEEIRPFTTDQIKNRMASGDALPRGQPDWQAVQRLKFDPAQARQQPGRWNFSPWADFRTYMDLSLAGALDHFRNAIRAIDPATPVGIEGTQMPHAFGGYDLWRLAQALDWVEPYDIANAREIFGSFMPGKPVLCTLFEKETNPALRRLWHLLLMGDKGCIVWWSEDCLDWKREGLPLTPKALALAPALKEMTSPLAGLFLRAAREEDPIAIHYSQPSVQAAWLIESTVDGSTWLRRFSSYEASHNRQAKVRNSWVKLLQDLGFSPRFVSAAQIEQGELTRAGVRLLVLPNSWALGDRESEAIRTWAKTPGTALLADGTPGFFDAHARLRQRSPLEDLFPAALSQQCVYGFRSGESATIRQAGDLAHYARDRLQAAPPANWPAWAAAFCAALPRAVTAQELDANDQPAAVSRLLVHRFRLGQTRLLALERNINYHMSEDLKQAGGNEALEKPVKALVKLAEARHIYDLRQQKYLGQAKQFPCLVDAWRPELFALTDKKLPEGDLLGHLRTP